MNIRNSLRLRNLAGAITLIALSACSSSSGSPDNGGDNGGIIIGTGITLDGTATSNKQFASKTIEVRSRTGERSSGSAGNQGRFSLDDVSGSGPWLIRSDLGNNNYLYGIATDTDAEAQVQNIHSYSDAVVRSWYTSNNLDVDTVFASNSTNAAMPTDAEVNAIYESLTGVVVDVIDNYDLTGVNLNTVEFLANRSGVDKFILENPVIHSQGTITVVVFDPLNKTASVAIEDYDLSSDLTETDNTPPSAPGSLRALPSASDEITLVWNVASDNVGIARYAITRNGQQVATSPYPVYVDGGLTGGSNYNYSVIAIDAAGNESAPSMIATAAPQVAMDTTAPPAPSSVRIDTRRGTLDLEWTLSEVGDIASFEIFRSRGSAELSSYVNVTSNFFFDAAVDSGIEYCYTITAVDASGNESAPTGRSCATAPGAVVTSNSNTPAQPSDSTPSGDRLTAPQVDVSALACTEELAESTIDTEVTISPGCYLAPDGISVRELGKLTIEPGVVIKFGLDERLNVASGASLIADGTATNPIVLTGRDTFPGYWTGVRFVSNNPQNKLNHVQIEYAGAGTNNYGAIDFNRLGDNPYRVSITNSTMRFNAGPGITMLANVSLSTFDGNRITGNAMSVLTNAESVNLLDKRSSYVGNTVDAIVVADSDIDADTTWPALPVPYHADKIDVDEGVLSVEAGVNILFEDEAGIVVSSDGTLDMSGTEDAPISLSALSGVKGGWEGLYYLFTDNDHQLRYVTIEHAGEGSVLDAAISINSGGGQLDRTQLAFDNVTITDSVGYGIGASTNTIITEFNNVTITGNDGLANVGIQAAQAFNNAGNFTGNASDVIVLHDAFVDEEDDDVTLSNSDVPYQGNTFSMGNTFTLEEGVSLLMEADGYIRIGPTGTFITNGTASNPVSIVGLERTAGFWDGIEYALSSRGLNRLTYTLLADGGGDGSSDAANAEVRCISSSPVRLSIENSQIENSAGFGLNVSSTSCEVDIDAGTTFTGNALGDMN